MTAGEVVLVPRAPSWPAAYDAIAGTVRAVLGERAVDVHHVGSTAIATVQMSKPVIDVLVEVRALADADAAAPALAGHGFEERGEYGIPGRRYFVRPASDDRLRVHVHVFQTGHLEIRRHLAFRDYLRTQAAAARDYTELKRSLARRFSRDKARYQAGKAEFILRITALAIGENGPMREESPAGDGRTEGTHA